VCERESECVFENLIGSKSMSFSVCAYESECVFVNVTGVSQCI
jgi:hypothetical protein